MLNAYERQLILFYLSNAASRFHRAFPGKKEDLAEWVAENRDILALRDENEEPESTGKADTTKRNYPHGNGSSCGRP